MIEEERGEKPERYSKDILRRQLLGEIAKQVGTRYKESKDIKEGRRFIIPRSKMMEGISEEELQFFINKIEVYAGKQLSKNELQSVNEQVSGIIKNRDTRASLIVAAMEKMPDQDEAVEKLTQIMSDPDKLESIFMMDQMGLMDKFIRMSPERREKSFGIINETLASRIRKPGENLPKEPEKREGPSLDD